MVPSAHPTATKVPLWLNAIVFTVEPISILFFRLIDWLNAFVKVRAPSREKKNVLKE